MTCSFGFLTELQSFTFDCYLWRQDEHPLLHNLPQILRLLEKSPLQNLKIVHPSMNCAALNLDAWTNLASLLESAQFLPTLHTLIIAFSSLPDPVDRGAAAVREHWIKERFSQCAARGILRVRDESIFL
jgi:hypothetical protein